MKRFLIAFTVFVMFLAAFSTSIDARRHYTNDDNTCTACWGSGKCRQCEGRGSWIEEFVDSDGEPYEETVYCNECNGSGVCWLCGGYGVS